MDRRRLSSRAIKLAVAVLVVGFLAAAIVSEWGQLHDADLEFTPLWLLLSLVPLFAFQATQGELALAILRDLDSPLPPVRGRSIFGAALLARYVPTGALVFALRIGMNEREGVPKRVTTVALVYEIALALTGAALTASPLAFRGDWGVGLAVLLPLAGGLVGLHPAIFRRVTDRVMTRLHREPLATMLPYRRVLLRVVAFAGSFALGGLALTCALRSITPVDASDVPAVTASFGLGFITGMLGFALPGGLGAREAGIVAGLSGVVSAPIALAAAAVSRLVQTAIEFSYAGLAHAHDRVTRRTSVTPPG